MATLLGKLELNPYVEDMFATGSVTKTSQTQKSASLEDIPGECSNSWCLNPPKSFCILYIYIGLSQNYSNLLYFSRNTCLIVKGTIAYFQMEWVWHVDMITINIYIYTICIYYIYTMYILYQYYVQYVYIYIHTICSIYIYYMYILLYIHMYIYILHLYIYIQHLYIYIYTIYNNSIDCHQSVILHHQKDGAVELLWVLQSGFIFFGSAEQMWHWEIHQVMIMLVHPSISRPKSTQMVHTVYRSKYHFFC